MSADSDPLPVAPEKTLYVDFFDAPWVGSFFRPLLIALVTASLVGGPLALLRVAGASWRVGYVLPFACFAALEGVYSTLRLGRPSWRDRRGLLFRAGEFTVLLVLFRVAVWAFGIGWPGLPEMGRWLREPLAFFDGQFIFLGIWIAIVWAFSVGITGDFLDLALQPDEIAARDSAAWGDSRSQWRAGRAVSRSDILGRFVARWTVGGIALVLCASLTQVDLAALETAGIRAGVRDLGLPPELLAALLGYFLGGLLLISQGRLAVLRARWVNQEIDVQPVVLRRWHVNSALAVLAVGVIAALLPMGTTSWLSNALEIVIAQLMRFVYLLFFLLIALFSFLLWPLRFLSQSESAPAAQPAPAFDLPTQAEALSRLPDWLGGAVLWALIALIVIYFGLTYLNAQGLLKGRPLQWLMRLRYWWRARWAGANAVLQGAAGAVVKRLRAIRPGIAGGVRPLAVRVSALTPRERVRYFYLRMIGRAAERGLIRPPHQTPAEFAQQLDAQWPDAEVDVDALTTAFLAARYDRREIPAAEAQGAQAVWRRLMRALRSGSAVEEQRSKEEQG